MMKSKASRSKNILAPLQSGQLWQLADSRLRISVVGKTLVHYKHDKGLVRSSPVYLSRKGTLEKFLQKQHAFLLSEPAPRAANAGRLARPAGQLRRAKTAGSLIQT